MILVFNASPVIVLSKAGLLETMVCVGVAAKIPQAVVDEILQTDDADDPAKRLFQGAGTPSPAPAPANSYGQILRSSSIIGGIARTNQLSYGLVSTLDFS